MINTQITSLPFLEISPPASTSAINGLTLSGKLAVGISINETTTGIGINLGPNGIVFSRAFPSAAVKVPGLMWTDGAFLYMQGGINDTYKFTFTDNATGVFGPVNAIQFAAKPMTTPLTPGLMWTDGNTLYMQDAYNFTHEFKFV